MSIYCKFLSLVLFLALVGCGSKGTKDGKSGDSTTPKADEPYWEPFSVSAAPKIDFDDSTADITVDNGRMTIKFIADWKEKNEKRGNLFVFLKGGKSYPTLIVQKPDNAPGDIKDLDDTGKTAFLDEVTKACNEKYKGYILDKPKLIDIEGRPWVFYRVKMSSSTEKLEVPFLTTVVNGRKYTLELRAIEKKGNHDWPALLTMARGLTFAGDKKPAEPTTEPGKPVEKEPAKEPAQELTADPTIEK